MVQEGPQWNSDYRYHFLLHHGPNCIKQGSDDYESDSGVIYSVPSSARMQLQGLIPHT